MAFDHGEIFGFSGPVHLTTDIIDWNNPHHRRSIAACLVRGAYVVERDRKENRRGQNALAPPWWEFFNFQLIQVLVDPDDQSFFGCIYEFKIPPQYYYNHQHFSQLKYPRYVVAIRGTLNKAGNRLQDFKLDLRVILNSLHRSSRFQVGLDSVRDLVWRAGAGSIWLAGHSLGSSIASLVGKNMVHMGFHLETYLFNPPFISLPIEKIKNEKLKLGVRITTSIVTAGIAAVANIDSMKPEQDKEYLALSEWIPYLFVNPSDPICSEYIGYFAHREKMMTMAGGKIGRLAAQNSIATILTNAGGYDCEAFHLLASAYVTTNNTPSHEFNQAHGLHQWWRPDLLLDYKLHQFT